MIDGMIKLMLPGFNRFKSVVTPGIWASLLLWHFSVSYAATTENDFAIRVETRGPLLIVDSTVKVDASPEETWKVLTDFDHMQGFISGLTLSRIVSTSDDHIVVEQKGALSYGPFSVPFESVKRNELVPFKSIRTTLISGTFKHFDSTTTLVADGEMTRIVYHAEVIPDTWLPSFIGSMLVRNEAKDKFNEFRAEIMRRKPAATEK